MRRVLLRAVHLGAPGLTDVNLTVYAGDYIGILGTPGGLLKVLALVDPATAGHLFYRGRLVDQGSVVDLAYVPPGGAAPAETPVLLLADDPSPALLDQLEGQGGLTLVIASADPEIVARARNLYAIRNGTLIPIGG